MLNLLRQSTRAARTARPSQWIEQSLGRICPLNLLPVCAGGSRRAFGHLGTKRVEQTVSADVSANVIPPPSPLTSPPKPSEKNIWHSLPISCPGCGAPSQTVDVEAAGYFGKKRRKRVAKQSRSAEEDVVFQRAMASGAIEWTPAASTTSIRESTSVCDRCHMLHHNGTGVPIIHPSMQSIQAIIEESPHTHNHIYHVIDAADFPMSLISNLQHALELPRLRTQNRRSKSLRYIRGRVAEVSFIIARSDLLAPLKEQVDGLMPYLQDVLREALGKSGKNVRLGNVRCVSARRSWWTKQVKEEVYSRGGAGWMVGKVNVGKSALFEATFPKGRGRDTGGKELSLEDSDRAVAAAAAAATAAALDDGINDALTAALSPEPSRNMPSREAYQEPEIDAFSDDVVFDDHNDSLLPPAQPETRYPTMPLISSLPGTTASPIRIPFGQGKGELIDLPGIDRPSLEPHILPEHRSELIMKSRVTPEQHVLKPGQSLLLGGLIRITPKIEEGGVLMMYPFLPPSLHPHVTSTDKAIAIQTGVFPGTGEPYTGTVESIATPEAKGSLASAGTFQLKWDVTKKRAGPVTSPAAGKQRAETLPYIIYATDLLIEGVGWVEIVQQVRRRASESPFGQENADYPEVEAFSPEGKFVGQRRPMNGWLLGGPKKGPVRERKGRGRMSIGFQRRKDGGARGGG